ncbi:MAG: transposase [Nitrosomonas sp.]|nr:transposase [Nitrosomonas sp.]
MRGSLPEHKWRYYYQYLNYPVQLRRMLYTTNWIERFNKEIRKTTQHVNSFPNPNAALNLIFMVTKQMEEKTYRIPITSFYPSNNTWRRSCLPFLRHRIIDTTMQSLLIVKHLIYSNTACLASSREQNV